MKKLFTSLILLIVGVMVAQATVKVGGTIPNASTGAFPFSGSGSAVLSGKTLTLTNAVINAGSNPGIESDVDGLTIVIKGNCKITGTNRGLYLTNNTTLRTFTASTLTIDNSTQSVYGAIKVENGATLLAEWLHLNITAQMFGISGMNNETLKLQCCEVNIELTSPGSSHSCIYGFSSLTTNANYWANGESYNTSKKELYKGSTYATSCSLKPEMTIANYIVNTRNSYTFNGGSDAGVTAGSITYNNSSKTLTLDGVTYSGSYRFIDNYKVDGLKIVVKGTNTINNGNYYSIFSAVPFSIEGSSSTYSANKLSITKSYGALCLWLAGGSLTSGTLTLKNLTLDISGSTVPLYCATESGQSGSLVVEKCKISSKLTSSSTTHSSITKFSSVKLTDCCVNTKSTPVFYNSSKKQFTNTAGTLAQKVEIDVPTTTYGASIFGVPVTNLNADNFVVDGLTAGKISYSTSDNVLYMNKVTLTAPDGAKFDYPLNLANAGGLSLTDKNTITAYGNYTVIDLMPGTGKTYEIYGIEGQLTVKGTNTSAPVIRNYSGSLNVSCDELHAEGGAYGYYAKENNAKLTLEKSSSYPRYDFNGSTACIYTPNFEYNGKITSYTSGAYFSADKKTFIDNTGATVKGKKLQFKEYTTQYGLKIGETVINDVNAVYGLGSPYITAGGNTAVKYDASNKTLTLTGVTIDNLGKYANCIRNEDVDGLIINVATNSTLNTSTTSNWGGIYTVKPVTIKGAGKLTVQGTKPNISVNGGSLKLENINMLVNGDIKGYDKTETTNLLYVDLSNGKQVKVKGKVCDFYDITFRNGSKIVEPGSAYYDNGLGFVTVNGSTAATGIVFADKNTAGIDGIEADTNAEVIGIFDAQGRQLNEMRPGLNIIRMSDGTSRKVMVK